jgi:MFS family permease
MTSFFMYVVIQSIVAFELTGQNSAVGLVMIGQGLAMTFLGPIGGAIADRVSKKRINLISQTIMTYVFLANGTLLLFDVLELWHLIVNSFVLGVASSFMMPARQGWVVEIVPTQLRGNAIALSQVALNATRIWAPAIGGLMISAAYFGAAGAYYAMAAFNIIGVIIMLLLPNTRSIAHKEGESVLAGVKLGVLYLRQEPRLGWMMVFFFLMIMIGMSSVTALPGLLENQLNSSAKEFGVLQAVTAVGGLAASLAVAGYAASKRALNIYSAGAALMGVAVIATGLSPSYTIVIIPVLLTGVGMGMFQTLNSAIIAIDCDPKFFGRVSSLIGLSFAAFMLIGWPVGYLADRAGERVAIVVMGSLVLVGVVVLTRIISRTVAPTRIPVATEVTIN